VSPHLGLREIPDVRSHVRQNVLSASLTKESGTNRRGENDMMSFIICTLH